ncbi:hypothetical protein K9M16_05140, partial [Candidatus Babeliales bacterium]|nr:hypothetical protein [Candidatus Babeliales bacterium]
MIKTILCQNQPCINIIENILCEKLLNETNPLVPLSIDACVEGLRNYIKLYDNVDIEQNYYMERILVHLRELENYFDTGFWKRL